MTLEITVKPIEWVLDHHDIMQLEGHYEFPWNKTEARNVLNSGRGHGNSFGARDGSQLWIGHIFATPSGDALEILNLMVEPEFRLKGVGRRLIRTVTERARKTRKKKLELKIRETNIGGQLFFRKCGFMWVKTLHGDYDDSSEDAYILRRNV